MSESDPEWLSQDVIFDLLSNRRRRFILSYLYEHDEPTMLMEFATRIAAWENNVPIDEVTDDQQKRVYVSIYQTHIPKLEDAGVITYDAESGLIELTDRADDLIQLLLIDHRDEPPWQLIYVGVTLVGLVIYLLGIAGAVPIVISGFIVIGGVLGVALGQYLYEHLTRERRRLNLTERRNEPT